MPGLRRTAGITITALALYSVVFVIGTRAWGFPLNRQAIFFWVLLGLLAASAASPSKWLRGIVVDWLPLFVLLFTYDFLRGAADDLFPAHITPQLFADEVLGLGVAPTVRLQQWLLHATHLHWWDHALSALYLTHFVVPFAVGIYLWCRNRHRFRAYAARIITMSYLAFVTYALYPAVPPWMAGRAGDMEPVTRVNRLVWRDWGLRFAERLAGDGSHLVNQVAAVPSLHAAYPALLLFFFWRSGRVVRGVLAAYTLAMGYALVYLGEHFFIDIVLGWAYAGLAMWLVARASRWWQRRHATAHGDATGAVTNGDTAGVATTDEPAEELV